MTPAPLSSTSEKRQLDDYQGASQPPAPEAAAHAPAGILQRLHDIAARQLQRWREAEEQRGQHRQAEAESQHRQVQADLRLARNRAVRNCRNQRFDAGICDAAAERPSAKPEQHAFHQELTHYPPPAGAQRRADRHLPIARR